LQDDLTLVAVQLHPVAAARRPMAAVG